MEFEDKLTKKELAQLIETMVNSAIRDIQATRTQTIEQTTLLHYLNLIAKGKDFIKTTADLALAIIDAGVSIPVSAIRAEVHVPSLNVEVVRKWIQDDVTDNAAVGVIDNPKPF